MTTKITQLISFSFLMKITLLLISCSINAQDPTCGYNEEYRPGGGPKCENCGPRCLVWSNEAKCYCKTDFSRYRGVCIANTLCPKGSETEPQCPTNEEFSLEGGPLCENCGPVCLALTGEPKCYCKPRHSRLRGVCIPNSQCPPENNPGNPRPQNPPSRCPINEEFSATGGAMCENCGPQCLALIPDPKCYCKAGHSRLNGVCIRNEDCPPEQENPNPHPCPQGEEFSMVGPACEFCQPRCQSLTRVAKCYCSFGHLRNRFGTCIPSRMCPY